tara:strand:- start:1466 stop:1621 length:156 start_codon:yes stop_codon:yes gene_type:complete
MSNEITEVIDILRRGDFYGAGDCVEIAKGKRQIVVSWGGLKTKVKRIIKAR